MATDTVAQPTQGLAAYRRVLAAPHVRPLVTFGLLARMPIGMGAVAIILFIHGQTDSFGIAGVVAGAYTIGLGITGPTVARLIDRHGSRLVIVPGALLVMAAMVAAGAARRSGGRDGPADARGLPRRRRVDPDRRHLPPALAGPGRPAELPTAYALDAVMIEVVFVTGPLLAGILAATVGTAEGLIVAGALGIVGSVGFARLSTVRPGGDPGAERHWLGALVSPHLRLLVLSDLPLAGTFGALDVMLPAFGAHHGAAALGGPFAAALAFGSGVGGIAYGARPGIFGPPRRALILLGGLMVLTCLPLPAGDRGPGDVRLRRARRRHPRAADHGPQPGRPAHPGRRAPRPRPSPGSRWRRRSAPRSARPWSARWSRRRAGAPGRWSRSSCPWSRR